MKDICIDSIFVTELKTDYTFIKTTDMDNTPPISKKTQETTEKPINNKWQKYLNDYDNYTREYIEHYKKALQGNTISLSLYPYMKLRSETLYEQLFQAQQKSQLTENQIQLIASIQIEYTSLS